jgi:hypothetical protein
MRSKLVREKIRWPAWELDDGISRDYCTGELASSDKDSKPLRASSAPSRARLPEGQVSLTSAARWPWRHYRRNSNLLTGATNYLEDINSILSTMLQTRTFLRPGSNVRLSGNVLLNDRDGWSDDIFAQNFAYGCHWRAWIEAEYSRPHNQSSTNAPRMASMAQTGAVLNGTPNIVGCVGPVRASLLQRGSRPQFRARP